MRLRAASLAVSVAVAAASGTLLVVLGAVIILGGFRAAEERSVAGDAGTVLSLVTGEEEALGGICRDWAAWDDTWRFVAGEDPAYVEANLVDSAFTDLDLSIMVFLDAEDEVVFAKAFDLEWEQEVPVPEDLLRLLASGAPLTGHRDPEASTSGVLLLDRGPYLAVSRPVVTSDYEGPVRGTLLVARALNDAWVGRLARLLGREVAMVPWSKRFTAEGAGSVSGHLSAASPTAVAPLDGERIRGFGLRTDLFGAPALLFEVTLPRDIYRQGRRSFLYFSLSLAAVGFLVGGAAYVTLRRRVVSRILRLGEAVRRIGDRRDFTGRVPEEGGDEITTLSRNVNAMLGELEDRGRETEAARDEIERRVEERARNLLETNRALKEEATEHRRTLVALRRSEERVKALLEAFPDAFYLFSGEGVILNGRPPAGGGAEAAGDAIVGRSVDEVFRGGAAPGISGCIREVLRTGEIRHLEITFAAGEKKTLFEARFAPAGHDAVLALLRPQ